MTDGDLPLASPEELAAAMGPAERRLVLLDFDGVLAPIVDRHDRAAPSPGAIAAIEALADRTAVAIVSGRGIADLTERLGGLSVGLAGGHGAEIVLADGSPAHLIDPERLAPTLDTAERALEDVIGDRDGWLIERKPTSLAVHHRLAPPDTVEAFLPRVHAILGDRTGDDPGFAVLDGKAIVELRPASVDKGHAVDLFSDRTPTLEPLVLGDDTTDEDAFRAALARNGDAILVASDPRPTAATYRLADPPAVIDFLSALSRSRS